MQLTERQTFLNTTSQKQTLITLRKKYKMNTSEFIRKAVAEKFERERDTIFKNYKEVQDYLKLINTCPF